MRFRVLSGVHCETELVTDPETGQKTEMDVFYGPNVVSGVNRGPVIESKTDLCRKFNVPGYTPKFERIDGNRDGSSGGAYAASPWDRRPGETAAEYNKRVQELAAQVAKDAAAEANTKPVANGSKSSTHDVTATLEGMDLKELERYAAEEEIDLTGIKGQRTKANVLAVVRAAALATA